jgi:membrane protease YdiL (CAAX protease family)
MRDYGSPPPPSGQPPPHTERVRSPFGEENATVDRAELTVSAARDRVGRRVEIVVVLAVTFGWSGVTAALALIQEALARGGLAHQKVALNPTRSTVAIIDVAWQLLEAAKLLAWAALALYLLWRGGVTLRAVGLARPRLRSDVGVGVLLAAVIGLPGLGLYLVAHRLGFSVTIVPSAGGGEPWWRIVTLVVMAIANAVAEEVIVVGYLLTRLREIGWSRRSAWLSSALLRGSYHLYQGVGGGLGNLVMGLVFGRFWQMKTRLWPLVIAHAIIDTVAYVGYALLRNSVSWLP